MGSNRKDPDFFQQLASVLLCLCRAYDVQIAYKNSWSNARYRAYNVHVWQEHSVMMGRDLYQKPLAGRGIGIRSFIH